MPEIPIHPEKLKIIYTGNNSTLYFQETSIIGKPVVLKVMNEEFPSLHQIKRFYNEYDFSKEIEQIPGIRKIYEKTKYQNKNALVMEYVPGITVKERFADPHDLTEFLKTAIAITRVLAGLHKHHIIHKDICSNNILVHLPDFTIHIIDLGIASKLDARIQNPGNPRTLEGTLPYLSPEQTGRMNRVVDFRTDLYSLGVTFYEMLTGRLPFVSDDPMALVHAHIATIPTPVHEINPSIPWMVSDIVQKLMQKNAEDRYQSARGLCSDLTRCLRRYEDTGQIESFDLGREDYSDRFLIPQTLYGIETQKAVLMDTFNRAATGSTGCVMVTGNSGVGKTSLVREIHKPVTTHRGSFVSGKFDQYEKALPYSAIIQAFTSLINLFLMEDDATILSLKHAIEQKIERNGKVLSDLIPNLELILGEQPAVADLEPLEALNRFNLVCRNFIAAISPPDHPLVLFLDDLQWVDHASLSLIKTLLTDEEISSFLLIGAYRSNEVSDTHPLMVTLEELRKEMVPVRTIVLSDLPPESVTSLLTDTLHDEREKVTPLSELMYKKTGGNAFFVHQFLMSLYAEEYLTFDEKSHTWEYHLPAISSKQYTDNVVDLMVSKISHLSPDVQKIVRLASCIGNRFTLQTLAAISHTRQNDIIPLLYAAIHEGLILPLDENLPLIEHGEVPDDITGEFAFLHDRVEQAAYSLIPEEEKAGIHLEIGRTLLASYHDQDDSFLFPITGQFNKGLDLMHDEPERIKVAELNLKAGLKAKKATAHAHARDFMRTGMDLLPPDSWERYHDLTFQLVVQRAECEHTLLQYEESENLLKEAFDHARSVEERLSIFIQQINQATWEGRFADGIHIGIQAFREFDIHLPDLEDNDAIAEYIQDQAKWFSEHWKDNPISDLVSLPESTHPVYTLLTHILGNLIDAGITLPVYLPVLTYTSLNLSIQHGNTPNSAYGLISHGMALSSSSTEYSTAYEFGKAGLALAERIPDKKIASRVTNLFVFMGYVKSPLSEIPPYGQQAYRFGMDSGEFTHAGYGLLNGHRALVSAGVPLSECVQIAESYLSLVNKLNRKFVIDVMMSTSVRFTIDLTGRIPHPEFNNPEDTEAAVQNTELDFANALAKFYRLYSLFILERDDEALPLIDYNFLPFIETTVQRVEYRFIVSLLFLRNIPTVDDTVKNRYLGIIQEYLSFLRKIAETAPYNFLSLVRLIEAELAALEGRPLDAMHLYDEAIQQANEHNFFHYEAIARECAGKFWVRQNKPDFAGLYLEKSVYCYNLWGAGEKVRDMEEKYLGIFTCSPGLSPFSSHSSTLTTSSGSVTTKAGALDITTIIKTSQALSEEVHLETLLEKMIRFVMENAGATKGVLLTLAGSSLSVQAAGEVEGDHITTMVDIPLNEYPDIPRSVVHFTERTKAPVILENVQHDTTYEKDPYIRREQPKSILCMPIENKGELRGVLYLENSLSYGAFTQERIDLLRILGTQAAISIENARLYQHLEDEVEQRTQEIQNQIELLNQEIAVRKEIEKELSETYEIFRLFTDNSSEVLYITDISATRALYMSPSIEKISGYTVEEAMSISPTISMPAESFADIGPKLAERARLFLAGSGDSHEYIDELLHYRKDGSTIITEITSRYIRNRHGEPIRICVLRDITERKKIEEALKESESFNRGLVENLPDYIAVYGYDQKILYANPALLAALGYRLEELVSMPVISFFSDEFRKTGEEIISSRIQGSSPPVYEADIICHDKSRRSVIIKGTRIQYHHHPAILLLMNDITLRKEMERTLKENEKKFVSIFEKTPDPVLILNSLYQIIEVNRGFEKYFEYSHHEVQGKHVHELDIRLSQEVIESLLTTSTDEAHASHREMELVKGTGAPFIAEVAISRIMVNTEPCFIIQIHDIDEIRKAHEAISQVNHKLKILSSITRHDILNRIMVTSAYSEMLLEDAQDPDVQRKLYAIRQTSDEIKNLIEFTGQYQNLGETIPTWHVVEQLFKHRSIQGLLSGIRLTMELHGIEIYADNMLEKVIYNLVENSVRHGKNLTRISLSSQEESGTMMIWYEDDGGGIISEEKEKAFEKGFGKNTGLGLFLIREILSITGISILENGIFGEGVRFEITVPAGKWRYQSTTST